MRHLAAYLLLQIGGNTSPSAADIKKVLGAVGIEADDERLEKLISELEGKDVNELIAEGSSKLASVPSGGAVAASGGAAAPAGGAAAAEEKEEEKKEEEKEESDDDMGFGLFD
ncbi:60s acidic ribosomal protein-domain-containing protein [Daedaleopsis nitida]|nr:60s acidic ribosomal protein-domain-containing protein [Daedaleopsis nitida]